MKMKTTLFYCTFLASLLLLTAINLRAAEEDDLIANLKPGTSAPDRWAACQRLRVLGSTKAIPALAALLTDEASSHAARHALEGLPGPEVGAALRQALPKTAGQVKAGIIESLGWRGETAASSALVPLLKDPDTTVAASAAVALGRIGGTEAIAGLSTAREDAEAVLQPAIQESLLKCAERLGASHAAEAGSIYRALLQGKVSPQVRAGAWRGLVLTDQAGRSDQLLKALEGGNPVIQMAACKLLRELNDRQVINACVQRWNSLPAESQLAVLDAQLKLGAEALPTVRLAAKSPNISLRVAAWNAFADLGDPTSIPALAKAAAHGQPAEREAAQESLTRVRGDGVRKAILGHIESAPAGEKAELLRSLGERSDRDAVQVLLKHAASEEASVRLAALESVRRLAPPQAIEPLLDIAAKSGSDDLRDPVLKALYAVCEASPNKEAMARSMVDAMGRFPAAQRRQILPLLAELGTADALRAAEGASKEQDLELAKEAVRVLGQWPNAGPAEHLLQLAQTRTEPTVQTLALRGAIEVAAHEPDTGKRLALLQRALQSSKRGEEKKQALGQIGQIPTEQALAVARKHSSNPELANEALLAAISVAEKLAPTNPKLADEVAASVLEQVKEGDLARRAWALRIKPSSGASFIRDWVVAGPFRQAGIVGAEAVFNIAFAPEKAGQKVEWRTAPPADSAELTALFPGAENCAAYLRTHLLAPQDCNAVLLMGSDDGLKVWLNGQVVHSNNIDRGQQVDQDAAPIKLKKGANELMLKVTQGGGGWSACARVIGTDGKAISGLMVERPTGAAQAVAPSGPSTTAAPKAAALPKRDAFRTLRLSDQFYAEGAFYGDFNKDGRLDIVAGPFWFEGPDFQKRHEYRPAKVYDPKDYSDNFLTFTGDFNADGWTDILAVPFPGVECFWYENPRASGEAAWKKHLAYANVGNESPMWGDVTGDGQPELIFCNDGYLGYAGPNPAKPAEAWQFRAVSTKDKRYQRFTHGVGFGDVNGDKRVDLLEAVGWWEQPAQANAEQPWIFHPFQFADAAAQMLVYDVDGDGLNDVITAWNCHLYGMVWWQQIKAGAGQSDWKKHVILSPTPDVSTTDFRVSQMHALELVDMNGDGLKDILTGKRFWAHGPTGDKEPDAPALVFWLELKRGQGGANYVPHLIDDNSGVGTQVATAHLNADGKPDVIVGNKKGIFVHLSQSR
jgi:HEAT repeat protein